MIRDWHDKTVWLIGASSGIGHELACQLSELGAELILSSRSEKPLNDLVSKLGKRHTALSLDVCSDTAVEEAFEQIQHRHIDSIIFLAGAYEPGNIREMDYDTQFDIINTNLNGAINVSRHSIALFHKQGKGQIVIFGSVAGYRGLEMGQPYSASKAGLINFAESLYLEETKNNIDVKLINSGFVDTPLTQKNQFKMPALISTESAAQSILKGLSRSCFEIHFPKRFTLLMKLLRLLPNRLYFWIASKMNS
jgi:short-subunit dehydrogenase